jgi:hypothetical protein
LLLSFLLLSFLFLKEPLKGIIIIINLAGLFVFVSVRSDDVFYLFLQKQKIGAELHVNYKASSSCDASSTRNIVASFPRTH